MNRKKQSIRAYIQDRIAELLLQLGKKYYRRKGSRTKHEIARTRLFFEQNPTYRIYVYGYTIDRLVICNLAQKYGIPEHVLVIKKEHDKIITIPEIPSLVFINKSKDKKDQITSFQNSYTTLKSAIWERLEPVEPLN